MKEIGRATQQNGFEMISTDLDRSGAGLGTIDSFIANAVGGNTLMFVILQKAALLRSLHSQR